jgi:hypothetical protein
MKKYHTYPKDLTGLQFAQLTVLEQDFQAQTGRLYGRAKWWCKCHCGKVVSIRRESLVSKGTKSCGCLRRAKVYEARYKHGKSVQTSRAYRVWVDLMYRQRHTGTSVDDAWKEFVVFFQHMGEPKSPYKQRLCKLDPVLPYAAWNCFWGTKEETGCGKKLPKWWKWDGKYYTLKQLCYKYHLNYRRTYSRLYRGRSLAEALRVQSCHSGPKRQTSKHSA